jgi:hypothetical protein
MNVAGDTPWRSNAMTRFASFGSQDLRMARRDTQTI